MLRRLFTAIEMVPLVGFLAVRGSATDITTRIFVGGALSFAVFCLYASGRRGIQTLKLLKFTPVYLGANVFFIVAASILMLPLPAWHSFLDELRETGMFATITIVGVVWLYFSPTGLFDLPNRLSGANVPAFRGYSSVLVGVYAFSIVMSHLFRGDEKLAGGLPFVIDLVAGYLLAYWVNRPARVQVNYVK